MFQYEKALQYPVKIARPNARLAKMVMSQLGGPDGELGASLRYLSQRFAMPTPCRSENCRGCLRTSGQRSFPTWKLSPR